MAILLRITGQVQGVGYRAWFEAQARSLKLSGWVRNRSDGSVEALVDGEPAALERIAAWARRGPPAAKVQNVTATETAEAEPGNGDFAVRATH